MHLPTPRTTGHEMAPNLLLARTPTLHRTTAPCADDRLVVRRYTQSVPTMMFNLTVFAALLGSALGGPEPTTPPTVDSTLASNSAWPARLPPPSPLSFAEEPEEEFSHEAHGRELGHECGCHSGGSWIKCVSIFGSSECCLQRTSCFGYLGVCAVEGRSTCVHAATSPPPPPPQSLDWSSAALSSAAAERVMGSAPLYWGGGLITPHPTYTVTVGTKLTFNIVVAVNTLWLMPDRSAWSDCDFTNAVELAGPNHGGGTKLGFNLFQAVVTRPGTLYFACIRSDPFPGNGLHCRTLGQKAQVNIVEASPPPPSPSPPPPSPSPPPPSPLLSPPPPSPSLPTVCVDTAKNCKAGKCLFYVLSELWTKLQACKKTCELCKPLPESLPPSAPPLPSLPEDNCGGLKDKACKIKIKKCQKKPKFMKKCEKKCEKDRKKKKKKRCQKTCCKLGFLTPA
eukprot:scaffold14127_cov64-Phaeocystis_antarctica.AAC.4